MEEFYLDNTAMTKAIRAFKINGKKSVFDKAPFQIEHTVVGTESMIQVVFFDNNCTYIPDSLFEDCINLRDVVGMSKVEKIGKNAFRGCKKLENIGRVSKEIIVGEGAFDGTKIDIDEIHY